LGSIFSGSDLDELSLRFAVRVGSRGRESWPHLPRSLRRLHCVHDIESFSGRATVTRGSGLMARLIGLLFRFPKAGRSR
jgi:hypothetical protein